MTNKPREFWIEQDQGWSHKDYEVHRQDPHIKTSASHLCTHVIEAAHVNELIDSAIQALEKYGECRMSCRPCRDLTCSCGLSDEIDRLRAFRGMK